MWECFWDLAQDLKEYKITITVLASIIGHNYYNNKILVDAGALAMSKDISANQFTLMLDMVLFVKQIVRNHIKFIFI